MKGNKFKEGKMKSTVFALLVVVLLSASAAASEADILIQKLVEKGVITGGEGAQIASETNDEITKNLALGESNSVPKWVQTLGLKGDVRERIQIDQYPEQGKPQRLRERFRLRVSGFSDLGSGFHAGFGFASGTDDPRSTNQTQENSFQHPDLRIDMAYAEYAPVEGLTLMGGKFPYGNFMFKPSDLLYDTDINFEGFGAVYQVPVTNILDAFVHAGYLNIDENSADIADPGLVVSQFGINIKPITNIYLKVAAGLHIFEGVQGMSTANLPATGGAGASNTLVTSTSTTYTTVTTLTNTTAIGRTKTTTTTSKFAFDYDCAVASIELGINDTIVPMIKVFGEAVGNLYNDAALSADARSGYVVGLSFGDAKIDDFGKWQIQGSSKMLGKDAWVDFLPDSDAYSGKTASLVNELIVTVGLSKNTNFVFDYYHGREFPASKSTETDLFQFDFNFKF